MGRRFKVIAAIGLLVMGLTAIGCTARQGERTTGTGGQTATQAPSVPSTPTTAPSQPASPSATVYIARLTQLNDSGVTGLARVEVNGNAIDVTVNARGLTPDQTHPIHIHGFRDGAESKLPPTGTLSAQQIEQFTGPPLLGLEPFPKADSDGSISFRGTFQDAAAVFPLDARAIMIHGLNRDGAYDLTVPVAVGLLKPVEGGSGGRTDGGRDGGTGDGSGGDGSDGGGSGGTTDGTKPYGGPYGGPYGSPNGGSEDTTP